MQLFFRVTSWGTTPQSKLLGSNIISFYLPITFHSFLFGIPEFFLHVHFYFFLLLVVFEWYKVGLKSRFYSDPTIQKHPYAHPITNPSIFWIVLVSSVVYILLFVCLSICPFFTFPFLFLPSQKTFFPVLHALNGSSYGENYFYIVLWQLYHKDTDHLCNG